MIRTLLLGTAALSLSAAPALAAPIANPAASLSISNVSRTASPSAHKSDLAGSGLLLAIVAAAVVVAGIVVIASSDDNSDSN